MSSARPTTWQVMRTQWRRLSAYVVLLVLGVTALWAVLGAVRGHPLLDASLLLGLSFGILMGTLLVWGLAREWAAAGGRRGRLAYNRALRTRRLPADADDETWLRLLDQTEQQGSAVTFRTIIFSIAVALNVGSAVTSSWPHNLLQWLMAAAFAGVIVGLVQTRPQRAAARDLLEQLRARRRAGVLPADAPTSGTSPRD